MPEPTHPTHFDAKGDALCTFGISVRAYLKDDWLAAQGYVTGESVHGRGTVPLPRRPDAKNRDRLVRDAIAKGFVTFHLYNAEARARGDWEAVEATVPAEAVVRVGDATFSNYFDDDVLAHFFTGTPADKCARLFRQNRTSSPQGTYMGFSMRRDEHMAERGSMRLWYDASGRLFSYAMCLGLWTTDVRGARLFLVNGDGSPTQATGRHQREMREYLEDVTRGNGPLVVTALRPHAIVPFSVLRTAGIDFDRVTILDATPARVRRVPYVCTKHECSTEGHPNHVREDHFLGETLLRDPRGRVFLSGLDRNDSPDKRSYYICQVPGSPATVEEALAALRPEGLAEDTPRQGEWFFVPEPGYKPAKDGDTLRATRVPVVSADAKEQLRAMRKVESYEGVTHGDPPRTSYRVPSHEGRHVATTLVVNGAVYARGLVHDREHSTLRLGPTYHRVVKNRAIEGWRYDPVVQRARVD